MKKAKVNLTNIQAQNPTMILDPKRVKKIKGGYGGIVLVEEDVF